MTATIEVPLNTAIADLDETLRSLIERELPRHGFDGVDVSFDPPAREWSGQLTRPAVNVFLYDLRQATEEAVAGGRTGPRLNGRTQEAGPPLFIGCSYAVTAWAENSQDEHRLLSQVIAILFAYRVLPVDLLQGTLRQTHYASVVATKIGHTPEEGRADFWNAVRGTYKPSLNYEVILGCETGVIWERGPEVRTQTMRSRGVDSPRGSVYELNRIGGKVKDSESEPVANAWVALPDLGFIAVTNTDGQFLFARIPTGTHTCRIRTADGREIQAKLKVPSADTDFSLPA